MKITIVATYKATARTMVDIPHSWDEVISYYVRWNELHYQTNDLQWHRVYLGDDLPDEVDWESPISVGVRQETLNRRPRAEKVTSLLGPTRR